MQFYRQKPTMSESGETSSGTGLASWRGLTSVRTLLGVLAIVGIAGVARAQDPSAATTTPATSPTGAASTTGAAPSTAPVSAEDAAASFNRELLGVEEQVDDLKERVFRSKATLQLLKEIVIEGSASGARATIWHVNRLGTAYKMESITYLLDGQSKFSKSDPSGSLSDSKEFKIHDGALAPGDHQLSVDFKLRPTGFGIFKYVQNYEIDVRSNYAFNIEVGKQCIVKAIVTDRGGLASSFEERAKVDYEFKCERLSE